MLPLWSAGVGLIVLLLFAATTHQCMRARSFSAVAARLRAVGRLGDLEWVTLRRNDLVIATATLRTAASLSLVLIVVEACEFFGLSGATRNVSAFVIAFALVWILVVAVAATISNYSAGAVITAALPILKLLHFLASPALKSVHILDRMARLATGMPPRTAETDADDVEKEILGAISEGKFQGAFDEQEHQMIESVIQFADIDVGKIMTPRTEIIAIEHSATVSDAIKLIEQEGHSRIPVYDESIDNILGVLYAKDLLPLAASGQRGIADTIRLVPFVPDSKPVRDLLTHFRERKVHMAIVLDEYGGTSGLVTIEDILEELVGEIVDEYEQPEASPIQRIDEQTVEVDARVRVDELNHELQISLPETEDYETVGGFVFSELGRIPRAGEMLDHANVRISVVAAEPRRINRLRVQIVPPAVTTPIVDVP